MDEVTNCAFGGDGPQDTLYYRWRDTVEHPFEHAWSATKTLIR